MEISFESTLIEWRGPAPFVFAPISADDSAMIKDLAKQASYGWGCIEVSARISNTEFTTAIMPKDGRYLLPIRKSVQLAEKIGIGDEISASICIKGLGF